MTEAAIKVKKQRKPRPSVAVGLWLIKRIERALIRYSEVPDTPFTDPAKFPWIPVLEARWREVRAELEEVLKHPEAIPNFQEISKDQVNITKDDRWKTFFLYGYGYRMQKNCALCPETARLVESIPGMFTAFFSVLSPGKRIPLHRGPYKGLLRCHLGLVVPGRPESCWIEVGGQRGHWQEGKCIVFDDTYKHQVHNDTAYTRVVLFLDIIRPMRFPGSWLNRIVLAIMRQSPFIRDAVKNQVAWEKRLGEA